VDAAGARGEHLAEGPRKSVEEVEDMEWSYSVEGAWGGPGVGRSACPHEALLVVAEHTLTWGEVHALPERYLAAFIGSSPHPTLRARHLFSPQSIELPYIYIPF
jgi:hypothetical protein